MAGPKSTGESQVIRRWPGRRLALEAALAGAGYAAALCWASVCVLASFRPDSLSDPYWSGLPHLRSDTSGIAGFVLAALCLCGSEYLRWRRRAAAAGGAAGQAAGRRAQTLTGRGPLLLLSASETSALLCSGLVGYLSVNEVTHPATLRLQATHLLAWPAEGTLRVVALLLAAASVAVLRYLWPARPRAAR
ncbi:MAG: hypothetical protein ACLPKE_28765 [Streptosporangiaceae bacterium]